MSAHDSLETRLTRVALDLDVAAQSYATQRGPQTISTVGPTSAPERSALISDRRAGTGAPARVDPQVIGQSRNRNAFGLRIRPAAIGALVLVSTASLLGFGAVQWQAGRGRATKTAVTAQSPNNPMGNNVRDFVLALPVNGTSPGGLRLTENAEQDVEEQLTFRKGMATSRSGATFVVQQMVEGDVSTDGIVDVSMVIERNIGGDETIGVVVTQTGGVETPSPTATVPPEGPNSAAVAMATIRKRIALRGFSHESIDTLITNDGQLSIVRSLSESTVSVTSMRIDNGRLLTSNARTVARTKLPRLFDGEPEIRFLPGTISAVAQTGDGEHAGWLRARGGQTLRISNVGVTPGSQRRVTIRSRTSDDAPPFLSSVILPAALETQLPHDGRYEILVGEGSGPVTFEISIA
jgi:hypothetical protein